MPDIGNLSEVLEKIASQRLFPYMDTPRILSCVLLIALLSSVLYSARFFGHFRLEFEDEARPIAILVGVFIIVIGGACVVAATRADYIESMRGWRGALYGLAVVMAHFGMMSIRAGVRAKADVSWNSSGMRLLIAGIAMIGAAILARLFMPAAYFVPANDHTNWLARSIPLLGSTGVVLAACAPLVAARRGNWGLTLPSPKAYICSLCLVVAYVAATYAVLWILSMLGASSLVELTETFWIWLLVAGVLMAFVLLYLAREKNRLWQAMADFVRPRRGLFSHALSMTFIFSAAVVCWNVLVAPGIYGNDRAIAALQGAPKSGRFQTNLIVTGTLLPKQPPCQTQSTADPDSGMYFCFPGGEGCRVSDRWQRYEFGPPQKAFNAVFASGSAFPVFPPHLVTLPNNCQVLVVDGGYAHNVPLEAASLADARQVLILEGSPDDRDLEQPHDSPITVALRAVGLDGSQLFRSSGRLPDLLFARAQELDRNVGRNLAVASLAPLPPPTEKPWPFLLDFRKPTRKRMLDEADREIQSHVRIGHVESWGLPPSVQTVRAVHAPQAASWTPVNQQEIDSLLEQHGGVATFDMDDTCLAGDIGDAMFLKLIVNMKYRGDRDDFWKLFPDPKAAGTLREYWNSFHNSPGRYLDISDWSAAFTDYVVLFLKQYEALLRSPSRELVAYPWVVRLMVGLTPEQVRSMGEELWHAEMARSTQPLHLHSARYGDWEIEGGVRVRKQFSDLIRELNRAEWRPWVVTASSEYIAQVAAARLGIPADRVIGIRLKRKGSEFTSEIDGIVPYGEGKHQAIEAHHLKPTLAAGDTTGDTAMLRSSQVAIVVDHGKIPDQDMVRPTKWLVQSVGTFVNVPVEDPVVPASGKQ